MFHASRQGRTILMAFAIVNVAGLMAEVGAEPLRYTWTDGQKFSYEFDITVSGDDSTITYKGVTNYTVTSAGPEQMRVTYSGGLSERTSVKASSRSPRGFGRPSFGPSFGGPRGLSSRFSTPTFAGKTMTTNRITMTPRGDVLAMEGDSQLPYLLGNVSLLPFEALPEGNERKWTLDSGVAITKGGQDRSSRFGPFGPFGPYSSQEKKTMQSANEVTRYDIQGTNGDLVTISRSYDLTMPRAEDDSSYKMAGTGTWTFDKKDQIPHALDMDYKLIVNKGNVSATFPISVKYTRLSAEELARREAAAKQAAEERARKAAEAKAKAEAPLTLQEKRDALSALASRDSQRIIEMLNRLADKTPLDPDPQVVAAIEKHLDSPDEKIAQGADKSLRNWSPEYKLKMTLAKAYEGPGVLESTGLAVESITPLCVGQLVQSQGTSGSSFWRAARVEALLPDGTVKLGFLRWGEVHASQIVPRGKIQLAPEELEQPVELPSITASSTPLRTWKDKTGRFELEAEFVRLSSGNVSLRRADNRVIDVPLEKLSAADQAYIQQLEQAENPFAVD